MKVAKINLNNLNIKRNKINKGRMIQNSGTLKLLPFKKY